MSIPAVAILIFLSLTFGFFGVGSAVHYLFYVLRRSDAARWKHQPDRWQAKKDIRAKLPLVCVNFILLNGAMSVTIALSIAGKTSLSWGFGGHPIAYVLGSFVAMCIWYHLALFYVHRAMHGPWLMKRVHWIHHRYKTPIFLDALYEHPIEALWGAFVISAPAYVLGLSGWSYLGFVAIVGVHEWLDHSGININIPLLGTSKAHDEHHRRFHFYYGQLLPWLDRWHKTTTDYPARPRR